MMIVDVVFDIHIDSNAVVIRKPRINSRGERPINRRLPDEGDSSVPAARQRRSRWACVVWKRDRH